MTSTTLSPSQLDQQIKNEFGAFPALAAYVEKLTIPHILQDHSINLLTPLSIRPSGVTSSFDHAYSRGYLVTAGTAIILPVTTIFVLIRTYTKHFINKNGLCKEDCE